ASFTWARLPAGWQPWLPQAAPAVFAATTGLLAWLTRGAGWPWPATTVLVVAGVAHGTGFGTLAHRAGTSVSIVYAASFSGVLATTGQLATTTGIPHRRTRRGRPRLPDRRAAQHAPAHDRRVARPRNRPDGHRNRPAGSSRPHPAAPKGPRPRRNAPHGGAPSDAHLCLRWRASANICAERQTPQPRFLRGWSSGGQCRFRLLVGKDPSSLIAGTRQIHRRWGAALTAPRSPITADRKVLIEAGGWPAAS